MAKTTKKIKKETGSSLKETLDEIKKKFGDDSVMFLDQNSVMKVETIPTGSFGLDLALGVGGYPKGRIVEIYGPESSGKSTLAIHAVVEAQKKGGICAYIDSEHALDPLYAKSLGVDTKSLVISQPSNGEQALEMVESMARSGKFALIVVDSVSSLVPQSEIDGEVGAPNVGKHAKLMSQALRKLVPVVSNSKTIVIFINQIRMMINVLPGMNPETTTGGKALKFYSSVRIDIRKIAQIKKGEEIVGSRTRVKVVKNKVAPPYRQTEFDIMYGEGISKEGELLALGEKHNILLRTSGHEYYFGEIKLGRGYDASRTFLKENESIADELRRCILEKIHKDISDESAVSEVSNKESIEDNG